MKNSNSNRNNNTRIIEADQHAREVVEEQRGAYVHPFDQATRQIPCSKLLASGFQSYLCSIIKSL